MVEVVAGILCRADGAFMLASRPSGKPWAGYWEFPGGKIEANESPYQALVRELNEELGIHITQAEPWLTREHHYSHTSIRLHFYRVSAWQGEPAPCEEQLLSWQLPGKPLNIGPLLPANDSIIEWLLSHSCQ